MEFSAPKEQKILSPRKYSAMISSREREQEKIRIYVLPSLYTFGIQTFKDDKENFSFILEFPMLGHGIRTKEMIGSLKDTGIDRMTYKSANYFRTAFQRENQEHVPTVWALSKKQRK